MTVAIDTPLLIVGGGPAALVVATVVSGYSMGSLIIGHEPVCADELVELDADVLEILKPHGVINVLLPYADSIDPVVINASVFEQVLKHHCVVNMNITLYDGMVLSNVKREGPGASAIMIDGQTQWSISADHLVDTSGISVDLNDAIRAGAAVAGEIIGPLDLTA